MQALHCRSVLLAAHDRTPLLVRSGMIASFVIRCPSWQAEGGFEDMAPLSEPERRDFREICEDRYQVRSLILTSQLPMTRWHEQIGDPTVAEPIATLELW
jgi:hypothetical protein